MANLVCLSILLCTCSFGYATRDDVDVSRHGSLSEVNGLPKLVGYSLTPFYADTITDFVPAQSSPQKKLGSVKINDVELGVSKCGQVTLIDLVPKASLGGSYCWVKEATGVNGRFIYFAERDPKAGAQPLREMRQLLGDQKMGNFQFKEEPAKVTKEIAKKALGDPETGSSMWITADANFAPYKNAQITHLAYIPDKETFPGKGPGYIYWNTESATSELEFWELTPPCMEPVDTTYDAMVKDASLHYAPMGAIDSGTILLVIDMQVDFVTGSFRMPCTEKIKNLKKDISELIKKTSDAGGSIIASMDYHPATHCSFSGRRDGNNAPIGETCENDNHLTEADKAGARYHNAFPPHTLYDVPVGEAGNPTMASRGAQLEPTTMMAMKAAKQAAIKAGRPESVNIVFKGSNEKKESFSAMQHFNAEGVEEPFTGAFGLKEGMPAHCFTENPGYDCFPTMSQLQSPDSKMTSMSTLIKTRLADTSRPVTQILVTGLVFDYCAKETAIYTKRLMELLRKDIKVVIPVRAARPAMEGLPGVVGPLATHDYLIGQKKDLENAHVELATCSASGW